MASLITGAPVPIDVEIIKNARNNHEISKTTGRKDPPLTMSSWMNAKPKISGNSATLAMETRTAQLGLWNRFGLLGSTTTDGLVSFFSKMDNLILPFD